MYLHPCRSWLLWAAAVGSVSCGAPPYREEHFTYPNTKAGIQLGATLTIPAGPGPFAAAVLITGSGQQDRDEAAFGYKPFAVLAEALARQGIAVLRSDDRGIGYSGGVFAAALNSDFADDTEAAMAYLRTRKEVDGARIGLVGHSGGGLIAPLVAARRSDVAFIVLLAAPGVRGDALMVDQVTAVAEAEGLPHEAAVAEGRKQRVIEDLMLQGLDDAALRAKLRPMLGDKTDFVVPQFTTPWHREFLAWDPAPVLRTVKCPVLALTGGKDVQVLARVNLPAIRKALEAGGNRRAEVVEMPGLNHLMQTAGTGAPSEYGRIKETMARAALDKIASWVKAVTASS